MKKNNQENIKDVTKKLILKNGYLNVNISEVSKLTQIKRGMIYNYYKTKEDIYLDIFIDEINDYIDNINTYDIKNVNNEQFTNILVNNLCDNQLLLILIPIFTTIIEPNATLNSLIEFKKQYKQFMAIFQNIFKEHFNDENDEYIYQTIIMFFGLIQGLAPMGTITEKQKKAMEEAQIDYTPINIRSFLKISFLKIL